MSDRNKRTVLKFIDAMSVGDSLSAADCLAPEAVAVTKGFSKLTGSCDRDTILKLIGSMKALVPTGLGLVVRELVAEGDRVTAEFEGNALTIDGEPYCNQYCMVFHLDDGKITKSHEYFCTKLAEEVLWPAIEKASLTVEAGGQTQ